MPYVYEDRINPLNPELNPICYLLALLGAHHFLHVSRIRVKSLTLRRLMSYIYMEQPFLMFLDHTQRRSTFGSTPLDEWSARRWDLYLKTHDTHNRQISMPPLGFEPKISAGEWPCRRCCVVVCDLETSRMGAPYTYDISRLKVNIQVCWRCLSTMSQMMWIVMNNDQLHHWLLCTASCNRRPYVCVVLQRKLHFLPVRWGRTQKVE